MKERFMKFGNRTKTLVGAIALVVLMAVNVQVGMNDGSTTDINLLGLEASVFAPVAVATVGGGSGGYCTYYSWDCDNPYGSCFEMGAPAGRPCMIACVSGPWVYCDGCGGGCP